ncbi:MAG: DUF5694 domain-containing protein [Bacteroidia bacterium]
MKYIFSLLFSFLVLNALGQQKEVLIIGTMHQVPKLVKNSYNPLLKFSLKYQPEAIYVECVPPNDTISLNIDDRDFVIKSDSLKKVFLPDLERFEKLNMEDLNEFTRDDFEFMAKTYLVGRDYANYYYYQYLTKYGVEGSKEPLRNENADLSYKLAIALNLKYLYAMDDQRTRKEYYAAWDKCTEIGAENGDNEINAKIGKKQYATVVIPALLGRLGKHTNQQKSLNRLHMLNSFRYVQNENLYCDNATKFWNLRNQRMVKNIAEQINQGTNIKNIVMVGAGHVIGLKEALEKNYPDLKVKIMYQ